MEKRPANVLRVKNPLKKALFGPKIGMAQAVEQAERHVESLRESYVADLAGKIELIERLAGPGPKVPEEALSQLSILAPVIYNLAGTFGYTLLQHVAASLYDMLIATAGKEINCRALVLIHARAARLAAPRMPEIPEEEAENLLRELRYATLYVCEQTKLCHDECSICPL